IRPLRPSHPEGPHNRNPIATADAMDRRRRTTGTAYRPSGYTEIEKAGRRFATALFAAATESDLQGWKFGALLRFPHTRLGRRRCRMRVRIGRRHVRDEVAISILLRRGHASRQKECEHRDEENVSRDERRDPKSIHDRLLSISMMRNLAGA